MLESIFDALEEGAKEEVLRLSTELGWDIEATAHEYLIAGKRLSTLLQIERMRKPATVLQLVENKKGLERGQE